MIEDFYVDCFQVSGGTNHDWMLHHAGPAPRFSMPVTEGAFVPADWLASGTTNVRRAQLDGAWDARWSVGAVTSRLTMLGAPGTEVYALETFPVDNAVITPRNPPCQTLCVRRHNDLPFLAVGDAWRDQPNLLSVSTGDAGSSLLLHTRSNTWHLCFGPGKTRFADGVSLDTDAAFALLRNRDAILLVHGTRLDVEIARRHTASKPRPVSQPLRRVRRPHRHARNRRGHPIRHLGWPRPLSRRTPGQSDLRRHPLARGKAAACCASDGVTGLGARAWRRNL